MRKILSFPGRELNHFTDVTYSIAVSRYRIFCKTVEKQKQ